MTIDDIRYENLMALIAEAKTAKNLSEKTGVDAGYISQIKNKRVGAKMKKPQQVGDETARKLEAGMKKPTGWMDIRHNETAVREPMVDYIADRAAQLDHKQQRRLVDLMDQEFPANRQKP